MPFSNNQLIFAAFFVVVFIGIMVYSYLKDRKLHQTFYKGSIWVLLGFLIFIALLFLVKKIVM